MPGIGARCSDIAFIADTTLDDLPLPSRLGATRTGGIDLNKPRIRVALALATAPHGFTVAELVHKVATMTGQAGYTIRQAAYDLRKLRDQVIAPILAGVRSPRLRRKPAVWTRVDRDYETLRIGMKTLIRDLGITAAA